MRNLLKEPRHIALGVTSMQFANFDALVDHGNQIAACIAEAEAAIDTHPSSAEAQWQSIAVWCEMLADVLAAQDKWLADHDADVAAEVNALRREIRNLNASPPT